MKSIMMSLGNLIKSLLFSDLKAIKDDETDDAGKPQHSVFESLSSESLEGISDTSTALRFGSEDIFLFNEYAGASVATVGIYLKNSGILLIRNPVTKGKDVTLQYRFAMPDWQVLLGNWFGNGIDTLGFYNPPMGMFMQWNSLDGGRPDRIFRFGPRKPGLIALAGDWDGDGIDTIGLYDSQEGDFILKNTNQGGGADRRFRFARPAPDYIPIAGDWTGEGSDRVGLYRTSDGTFILKTQLRGGKSDKEFQFFPQKPDWLPVVGDWAGQGVDTVGLFDPAKGIFYLATKPFQSKEKMVVKFGTHVLSEHCAPLSIGPGNFFR